MYSKISLSLSLFLFIGMLLNAQITKVYDYDDFTKIDVSNAFEVSIIQSETYSISITIDESIAKNLDVKNENEALKIGIKGWKSNSKNRPIAEIQLPDLQEIKVSGACEVVLVNISNEKLKIDVSGASLIEGSVSIQELNLGASGASKIHLKGRTNKSNTFLSGASSFDATELIISDELIFDASGASTAKCVVNGDMYLKLSGASTFNYKGQGDVVRQEVSGASVVQKK